MHRRLRRLAKPLVLLALAPLVLALSGCELKTYKIKAGKHYSTYKVALFTGDTLDFSASFDDSAIYETEDPRNQGDINKLYGFSDCTSHHHENSARFGWRWYNDELQIHAYTYVDGTRISELMGVAELGRSHDYSIELDGDQYVFTFDGDTIRMDRGCSGNGGVKYRLYPYFGGDETAPHDVTIRIAED